jgi:hypothetical protein
MIERPSDEGTTPNATGASYPTRPVM